MFYSALVGRERPDFGWQQCWREIHQSLCHGAPNSVESVSFSQFFSNMIKILLLSYYNFQAWKTQFTQPCPFSSFEETNVLSLIPWLFVHQLWAGSELLCTLYLVNSFRLLSSFQGSSTVSNVSLTALYTPLCLQEQPFVHWQEESAASSALKPTSHNPLGKVLLWKGKERRGRPGGRGPWRWLRQMGTSRVDRTLESRNRALGLCRGNTASWVGDLGTIWAYGHYSVKELD